MTARARAIKQSSAFLVIQESVDDQAIQSGSGLTADNKSCHEIYAATGASQHPDDTKEFAAKRQAYFVNGCLGLPKPGSSSSSTAPTTTPHSPATTTAG